MKLKTHFHYTDKSGQALILLLILLPLCLTVLLQMLSFSRFIERKVALQNGIDAALLSGTEMLADGLNRIRSLNQKLAHCHKLLVLAQTGTILTGNGGIALTEKVLRAMIEIISKQQDIIKNTYPLLSAQKALVIARKNKTPHIFLLPPALYYRIERLPSKNGLPNLYQLKPDFYAHAIWKIRGNMYKGKYQAFSSAKLHGEDLLKSQWKGFLDE